jgi:hypothetical protein
LFKEFIKIVEVLKKKVSIKECRYIKSAVEFEYTYLIFAAL